MCTSYGVKDGTKSRVAFRPIDEQPALAEWVRHSGGHARITGRIARNLNPVAFADRLELGWWSLWRNGAGAWRPPAFNARDDSLMRHWRKEFQHRALLPASWYDEGKRRWGLLEGEGFMIAAVTSTAIEEATGERLLSYSMVTRQGVGEASTVLTARGDSRMPLVLPPSMHDEWLDPDRPGDAQLVARISLASHDISLAMTAHEDRAQVRLF